jgi:hypothetical protein
MYLVTLLVVLLCVIFVVEIKDGRSVKRVVIYPPQLQHSHWLFSAIHRATAIQGSIHIVSVNFIYRKRFAISVR